MKRVSVDTGYGAEPVTIVNEAGLDDVGGIEVADSVWHRYLAAAAEMNAVAALLQDLAEVDYARRRCTARSGEVRCYGIAGHPGNHWGWPKERWDPRGNPTWISWPGELEA